MNGTKINIRYLLLLFVFVFAPDTYSAVKISSRLDSAILLMGKQTTIHIEVLQDVSQSGRIINEPLKSDTITDIVKGIEYRGTVRNDTTIISESIQQINRDYLIQSFDSGLYTIPPFKYVVGIDTFKSAPLTLKVIPVQVDSIYDTITDYASIEQINRKWYDFIPEQITDNILLIILAIAIFTGLIIIIYIRKKRRHTGILPNITLPPFELAMMRLSELKGLNLCEKGQEKEFYTLLTDIIREYLIGRFCINALEMTSSQILDSIRKTEVDVISQKHIEKILEMADFVKFAKVRPLPDDNIKIYQTAIEFVKETKPEQSNTIESPQINK